MESFVLPVQQPHPISFYIHQLFVKFRLRPFILPLSRLIR